MLIKTISFKYCKLNKYNKYNIFDRVILASLCLILFICLFTAKQSNKRIYLLIHFSLVLCPFNLCLFAVKFPSNIWLNNPENGWHNKSTICIPDSNCYITELEFNKQLMRCIGISRILLFILISKVHNARASCFYDGTRSDDINQAPAHLIAIKSDW